VTSGGSCVAASRPGGWKTQADVVRAEAPSACGAGRVATLLPGHDLRGVPPLRPNVDPEIPAARSGPGLQGGQTAVTAARQELTRPAAGADGGAETRGWPSPASLTARATIHGRRFVVPWQHQLQLHRVRPLFAWQAGLSEREKSREQLKIVAVPRG
jgi:hypothetical protein